MAISTVGVAVLSPIMVLIAVIIKAGDGGPALYRGTRVGRNGRPFEMYKFRTMVPNSELIGGSSTAGDDARITRVGRLLRRSKLDELPQLLNVVKGEMSLVGPRPQVMAEVAGYSDEERELLLVRPGITDWASIAFRDEGEILRGHSDPDRAYAQLIRPKKMELGLRYARSATMRDDMQILWDTARLAFRPAATGDAPSFGDVTETWGMAASPEQVQMAYARYRMAGDLVAGRDALEVGCGTGMGLAYLRTRARRIVGVDVSAANVAAAKRHLPEADVFQVTGAGLPFDKESSDVVVALEMIYYVPDVTAFLAECRRVLRPDGQLIICLPNRDRPAFNPSPHSIKYPNAEELRELLIRNGFEPRIFGGFAAAPATARDGLVDRLRKLAVSLRLIPRTMRGKALVKRLLYGRLPRLGEIHDGLVDYDEPKILSAAGPTAAFKTLYAIGTVRGQAQTRSQSSCRA